MEQTACRFAVFADVDMTPEEVNYDFPSLPLPTLEKLGILSFIVIFILLW